MNITRVHQIYAAATSTGGDNVANIMVPYKGCIVASCIQLVYSVQGVINAELSFQSANQLIQNDATSQIVSTMGQLISTGTADSGYQFTTMVSGVAIPIDSISKVYAHVSASASGAWRLKGTLWIHCRA